MSEEEDGSDKEHEASQKKLDDAREKGEIPRSPDINAAAGYAGLLLAAVTVGAQGLAGIGQLGATMLDQSDRLATLFLEDGAAPYASVLASISRAMAPFFLLPMLLVVLVIASQRAFIFTPEKLMPKLSRISPIATAKQKFGRSGLFEFAKSFAKLVLVSLILTMFLFARMDDIVGTMYLSPGLGITILLRLLVEFLFIILIIAVAIGGLDYFYQRFEHLRKHRMSRKEMMDEHKSSEGDPHMKAQRRQRGYEIATNRMLADVPTADVVIVNPTHYAVALKWNRGGRAAPVCVAKGVDEVAARIREAAAESGVPIHRDPPTARALYATVEIGRQIEPEHYRAVAAAIRFAEKMRSKMRKKVW